MDICNEAQQLYHVNFVSLPSLIHRTRLSVAAYFCAFLLGRDVLLPLTPDGRQIDVWRRSVVKFVTRDLSDPTAWPIDAVLDLEDKGMIDEPLSHVGDNFSLHRVMTIPCRKLLRTAFA